MAETQRTDAAPSLRASVLVLILGWLAFTALALAVLDSIVTRNDAHVALHVGVAVAAWLFPLVWLGLLVTPTPWGSSVPGSPSRQRLFALAAGFAVTGIGLGRVLAGRIPATFALLLLFAMSGTLGGLLLLTAKRYAKRPRP